jgi:hypothetical protein
MLAGVVECFRSHSNIEAVLNDIGISDIDGFALVKRVHDNKADTSARCIGHRPWRWKMTSARSAQLYALGFGQLPAFTI